MHAVEAEPFAVFDERWERIEILRIVVGAHSRDVAKHLVNVVVVEKGRHRHTVGALPAQALQ